MRRREFLGAVGGATLACFRSVEAQQPERTRRIGVLLPAASSDTEFQARVGAFAQGLQQAGWSVGRNLQMEYRWADRRDSIPKFAAELVALAPDVILADGSAAVAALMQATRAVPIVFPVAGDPVAAGFVESLARPGGNVTGFMNFEYSISGKWLELLKLIAPDVTRVAVLRDVTVATGPGQYAIVQAVAQALGVAVSPIDVRDAEGIERGIAAFARAPKGGVIVTATPSAIMHRAHIVELVMRYKLPSIYFARFFASVGGLISYGPDVVEQYRRAAGYVDRILKGESPAGLPVQAPTKMETVINLKTAKELGLTVPPSLLARADEVIE